MLNNEFSHLHAVSVEKALPSAFARFHFISRQTHVFRKYLLRNTCSLTPRLPQKRFQFRADGEVRNGGMASSFVVVRAPFLFLKFTKATAQTFQISASFSSGYFVCLVIK